MKSSRTVGVAGILVVALIAMALVITLRGSSQKTLSAVFPEVVQLYPDDEVRVLGVAVGKITALSQVPEGVRVDMTYDADAPVPVDAKAVIVAPTLLNRRYVQLTPARVAGPRLPDGAMLGPDRTAVPLEYDEIKKQLDALASDLGPQDPEVNGALGQAVTAAAANLQGNGGNLHASVDNLAKALSTLSNGRDDLFGTVRNLQTLVTALRDADGDVNGFTDELAQTSKVLADSSGDLGKALDTIDSSVQRIGDFVHENRDPLSDDLKRLSKVADNLAYNRQALANVLQIAPAAISNFQNIYDPFSGAITGALAATNFDFINLFVRQLALPFPIERNGSANYITENEGRCKPPAHDPDAAPPYDPAVTPPKPMNGGQGTQPYFAERNKCHGPVMPGLLNQYSPQASSLVNLLLPGGNR